MMITVLNGEEKETKKKKKRKSGSDWHVSEKKNSKIILKHCFLREGALSCSQIFVFLPVGGRTWSLTSATSEGLGP